MLQAERPGEGQEPTEETDDIRDIGTEYTTKELEEDARTESTEKD